MSDTKENKKTFGDLKSGDTVWIGWADEERGKFGHIREIQVLNVLASRTDDKIYLRFMADQWPDIELSDTEVWPSATVGWGSDTTPIADGLRPIGSWVGMTWHDVAKCVNQSICDYIAEKTLIVKRLREKIDKASEELEIIRHG